MYKRQVIFPVKGDNSIETLALFALEPFEPVSYTHLDVYKRQVGQSAVAYNKIEVPQGGEYTLVLNDGTKVHRNSMSRLRFPLTFEAGKREVELTGEAYFEVNKTGDVYKRQE